MKKIHYLRFAGLACMLGAVLWISALIIEYQYNLFPPGSGTLFIVNQTMFAVAMVGYILGLFGLFWAGAVRGWFGSITLGIFLAGWCLMFAGLVVSLLGSAALDFAPIVGGIFGNFAALLAGIAIARHWRGWQRFAVLIYGLYYALVLFLPLVIGLMDSPTFVTETGWALTWLLIGTAVYTSGRAARRPQVFEGARA